MALLCRLKELGLSTAGNKKDLEARLQHSAASAAGLQQLGPSAPQPDSAAEKPRGKGRAVASTGVFKAQKRKNFVRINLKVWPTVPCQNCACIP